MSRSGRSMSRTCQIARTRAEHASLADLFDTLEARGHTFPVSVRRGAVSAGPVSYVHPNHPLRPSRSGIRLDGVPLAAGATPGEIELVCARAGL